MQTAEYKFRGVPFKVACVEMGSMPQHASWFTYEDEVEVRDRDWHVKPGDIVLDVGAGFGSYSVTALSQGAAFAWAWSPQDYNGDPQKDFFLETLRLNGWSNKCKIIQSGLYDKSGWLNTETQVLTQEQPASSVSDPGASPAVIQVETLDAWFDREKPGRVDWLKIDVEGAEVEVLKGGLRMIAAMRPTVLVENHLFVRGSIRDEVEALLSGLGYEHLHTHQHHSVSHSAYRPRS